MTNYCSQTFISPIVKSCQFPNFLFWHLPKGAFVNTVTPTNSLISDDNAAVKLNIARKLVVCPSHTQENPWKSPKILSLKSYPRKCQKCINVCTNIHLWSASYMRNIESKYKPKCTMYIAHCTHCIYIFFLSTCLISYGCSI